MRSIGEAIQRHVAEILDEWEHLVQEEPWYSLPPGDRTDHMPDVILGIADATLCRPTEGDAHRVQVEAAARHGRIRRDQKVPDHLISTEYHLLRQALWRFLTRHFGSSDRTTRAILRIDRGIGVATNASMWGYYRDEIEGLGKWEESIERIVADSRRRDRSGAYTGEA
jgi:hypothetical protein